jgi:hypothetical protein
MHLNEEKERTDPQILNSKCSLLYPLIWIKFYIRPYSPKYCELIQVRPVAADISKHLFWGTQPSLKGDWRYPLKFLVADVPQLWDCRDNSTITLWRKLLCQFQCNQNEHKKYEGNHYLMTVTHKVSDHHLHQWQALAANILHWLHVVAVDKCIKSAQISGNTITQESAIPYVPVPF